MAAINTRSLRHGVELVLVGGITSAVNFSFLVYAGRKLGPREYADFWAAMSLVYFGTMFLNPLAPFASHVAAAAVARGDAGAVSSFRRSIARFTSLLALPFVAIAALASRPLASFFHLRSAFVVAVAAAAIASYAFLAAMRGIFQGLGRFRDYNANTLVECGVRIGAAIALLGYAPTASTAVSIYLTALLVSIVLLLGSAGPRLVPTSAKPAAAVPRTLLDDLRATGIPMFVLLTSIAVFQNADSLAVKRWLPVTDAAAYSAAATLARTFTALCVPLWVLLVPSVASERDARHGVSIGIRICGAFIALAVVPLIMFRALSVPIYTMLYGRTFVNAAPLLVPLSGVVILTNVSLLLAQTLVGIARTRFLAVVAASALVEIVALSLYHQSVSQIIALLYIVHITLVLFLGGTLARAAR